MISVDNHSHILHTGVAEMIAAAKANKVREYSVTEHVSQFRELRESVEFGSVHSTGKIFASLKAYNDKFRNVNKLALGMKVNRGLEVDFSPRYEKRVGDFVNQEEWDVLLCSVHEFDDGKDIERKMGRTVNPGQARGLWRKYLILQQQALESDFVPFKVLAHPLRMLRATKLVPPDLDDLLLDLAKTAKRKNRALELNGNDIDYGPELVRKLATACSKAGCSVSLGSDAHYPRDVFRNMRIAYAILRRLRFRSWRARNPIVFH